ncbi:MAG: His-Xaa-Ser system protein HxsD [Betaproteobacteria bacterium]|nr:His-Xaa-Ser system protein HxsD [Betaproteobacteria bacterium]
MDRSLEFDLTVYSLDAIKKALYVYTNRISANIRKQDSTAIVDIKFKPGLGETSAGRILDELRNEVLDYDLRESVKKETEAVRNLILAHAFSKTPMIENE